MPAEQLDIVALYGTSKGWRLMPRSVLVEGASDIALFNIAARLFKSETDREILQDLAIVAAGDGDRGGTHGVIRELVTLRGLSEASMSPSGRPIYRFIGLFDNDTAGRNAVRGARNIDRSILEYRDVIRLMPMMPTTGNLDPAALKRAFETTNATYNGIDWELEDLVGQSLFELFIEEYPSALIRTYEVGGVVHRELTRDGKRNLIRFCDNHADFTSLKPVVDLLHALRYYLNLRKMSD